METIQNFSINNPGTFIILFSIIVGIVIFLMIGAIDKYIIVPYYKKKYPPGTGRAISYTDSGARLGISRIINWEFQERLGIPFKFIRLIKVERIRDPYKEHSEVYTFEYWEK